MIIYCYTNLINNKKYVGQTINPEQRFRQHKSSVFNEKDKEYNSVLHRAMRKYGYENFSYEVLAECNTLEELNQQEIYFINTLNTLVPNGYNVASGGNNGSYPHTLESKEKLMKAHAKLTEEEIIYLRKAYANRESPKQIYLAKGYDKQMHYNSFLNIWTGQRYKTIMPEVFNKSIPRIQKLTEEIVYQMKLDRKENNLSYSKLAKKYNISKSTVSDIFNNRTWKHVQI